MGSFDMNASWSRMPVVDETTVIICLKRIIDGQCSLIPIAYPIKGHYFDYGWVNDIEENEITKAICDFFEIDSIEEVIKFIYAMTIHGDYESAKNKDEFYTEEDKAAFYKYVSILDKLRKNSGIVIKSEQEIIDNEHKRMERLKSKWDARGEKFDDEKIEYISKLWLENDIETNNKLAELLDTYELALFYENTPVFDALCSYPEVDNDGKPLKDDYWYKDDDDLSGWSLYLPDKNNVFCITKDCNSDETIEIKKRLKRLNSNFHIESKNFILEETSIMGQDYCPYMWYKVGKAIHMMWKNRINQYAKFDIDEVDK